MVDKLILLDAVPFFLDCNVRMAAYMHAPSPVSFSGYQGGGRRWQEGRQGESGAPQQRKQGDIILLVPLGVGREKGAGAFVILGSPVFGLGSAECQSIMK